jgi:hypothetical protein
MRRFAFAVSCLVLAFPAVVFSQAPTPTTPTSWTYALPTSITYAQGQDIAFDSTVTVPDANPITGFNLFIQQNLAPNYPAIAASSWNYSGTPVITGPTRTDQNGNPNASGRYLTYRWQGFVKIKTTAQGSGFPVGTSFRLQHYGVSPTPNNLIYPFGSLPFNY